ncbi:MAG: magnesium-translocating P-type ATPase [Nocardioidaceae bacterium]
MPTAPLPVERQDGLLLAVPADVAGTRPGAAVRARLAGSGTGLTEAEARRRASLVGPNAVRTHRAQALHVLVGQLRSPLLLLLTAAAAASYFLGQRTDAVIIVVILALSVGLGFVNEYRAEVAAEALHSRITHEATVWRDGRPTRLDVVHLVPGDVVDLRLGEVVPADVRLLTVTGLECDESVLTGESLPAAKTADAQPAGAAGTQWASCAFMGTVVTAGTARAVVVATGGRAEFGRIALGLGTRQTQTEFQIGLTRFSKMLVVVAAALTAFVFAANLVLHRPVLDALLFSLAIAVGITPQLLPAVVSTSLAAGSRGLARKKVLVKRLICIEDLGDVQVLLTDKTGTLTEGRITFMRAVDAHGSPSEQTLRLGMLCNAAPPDSSGATYAGGDPLDAALWASPAAGRLHRDASPATRVATLPFDHDRRMVSVVLEAPSGRELVTKGAPESVLAHCVAVPPVAQRTLTAELTAGGRVVAVARRDWDGTEVLAAAAERNLTFVGLLVFLDQPKASATAALSRLHRLGVDVKVVTGDNPLVAASVCGELGLPVSGVLTGQDLDRIADDDALEEAVSRTTVFARVSPNQKARIVRAQRRSGLDVAFLGDGVNDALALHAADVGVSVDSAADVAKDAADIVLLEKDLAVLADGVVEGRRIFANTMKYVLMGTSSNFGNMFSAAVASAVLPFLPMLPSQILLNNLLYDSSQLAIPTDNVDEDQLRRPAHWDLGLIRRFMLGFGPLSSLFDFATFAIMLWGFGAGASLFHSAWFVESLATQTLVIFVIRTRRLPLRSHPSAPLLASALTAVVVGATLPFTPLAPDLGFVPLLGHVMATIAVLVLGYLVLAEVAKRRFARPPVQRARRTRQPGHRIHRRAARFSTPRARAPTTAGGDGTDARHSGARGRREAGTGDAPRG